MLTCLKRVIISLSINKRELPNCLSGKEFACQTGDLGSVPGLLRSAEERNSNPSSILAWKIPWTEELGGLQSMTVTK